MNFSEYLIPEYSVPKFMDVFDSAQAFSDFYTGTGQLEAEVTAAFLQKLWYMLYAKYGEDPIVGEDITQWKYKVLMKINGYAPTYIKKDSIQKALRALDLEDLREGYKSIFNRAINPSTLPSTNNTEELPYISDQNVNKTKKNKADAYSTLWEILRSNLLEEFLGKFAPLFSKVVGTTDRIVYISRE